MYCTGKGTLRNPVKGANYIEEGMNHCEENLSPSFYFRIGSLFYEGKTTENGNQDLKKAIPFLEKAAADGNEDIILFLNVIKEQFKKEEIMEAIKSEEFAVQLAEKQMNYYKNCIAEQEQIARSHGFSRSRGAYDDGYDEELKKYGKAWDKIHKLKKQLEDLDKAPSFGNKKNDIFDW